LNNTGNLKEALNDQLDKLSRSFAIRKLIND